MQQFDHESLTKVTVDMNDPNIPESVKKLQPVLFSDVNGYCCVLGPDPQAGVFGCGYTPEAALADWDMHVQERLETGDNQDEVTQYIRTHLSRQEANVAFETPGVKGLA